MTYEIQKGVPIRVVVGREGEYPLGAMDVGDMFEINLADEYQEDEFRDDGLATIDRMSRNLRANLVRLASTLGIKLKFRRLDKRDKTLALSPTLGVWRIK